uniref:Uncharacterized protein n=1 Tax=Peronospora matthiolae TaxID=2874970 RepID=A0AAV1U7I4_9STRA
MKYVAGTVVAFFLGSFAETSLEVEQRLDEKGGNSSFNVEYDEQTGNTLSQLAAFAALPKHLPI